MNKLILVLMLCVLAQGNMGVPMLAIVLPYGLLLLLPIVLLESLVIKVGLRVGYRDACKVSLVGNLITTIIGIPLTWFVLVLIEIGITLLPLTQLPFNDFVSQVLFSIITSPWVYPFEDRMHWSIPLASLILCVPFFFASFYIEYKYARRTMKEAHDDKSIRKAIFDSNVASYSVIILGLSILVLFEYYHGGS